MAGYVYRGTEHDVREPVTVPTTPSTTAKRRRALCGTTSGYHRHLLDGIPTCAPCKKAHADYVAAYRQAKSGKRGKRRGPYKRTHGTHAGYQQHLRWGERPCLECANAHRDYNNAYNAKRRNLPPCGGCRRPLARTHGPLPKGAVRHQAHGLCQACYMSQRSHQ